MLAATNQLTQRAIERSAGDGGAGPREMAATSRSPPVGIALRSRSCSPSLIARPIRQLDQAIRQMGSADFTHAIEVNGPQDLRYLGQRLEWLRSRLHELEEQQNRFLRHVSHELKTPLTAVREGAELLRDDVGGELSPEQQEIVRIVPREHAVAAEADRGPAQLPPDAQHRAADAGAGRAGRCGQARHTRAEARRVRAHDHVRSEARSFDHRSATPKRSAHDRRQPASNAIKYSPRSGDDRDRARRRRRATRCSTSSTAARGSRRRRGRIFESFYQGKTAARGPGQGLGPRARDRARIHAGARRAHRARSIAPTARRGAHFRLRLPLAMPGERPGEGSRRPLSTSERRAMPVGCAVARPARPSHR